MSSKDPMRDALQMMVYMIESNAPQLCGPVFENAKKLLAQPAGHTSDSVECARCVELEALCDATYVAQGADAYNHACSEMERWQAKRKQDGKDVGTEGSLCDGLAWLFEHIEQLESSTEAKGLTEPDRHPQTGDSGYELEACPFCGSIPHLPSGQGTQYEIECHGCGQARASIQISDLMTIEERRTEQFSNYRYDEEYVERAKQEAIKQWNTRV